LNQEQNEEKVETFQRICPNPENNTKCQKIILYKHKSTWKTANNRNTCCKSCYLKGINLGRKHTLERRQQISEQTRGEKNPFYGRHHSKETKELLREKRKLQVITEETREKISIACKGEKNGFYEKRHTKETIAKLIEIRNTPERQEINKIASKKVALKYGNRLNFIPGFNRNACELFDEINIEMGWNGKHALNGGEFSILGYWVDYYEPDLNIVIEFNEKYHNNTKQKLKDEERKIKIINELNCKFYNINQWENIHWKEIISPNLC